ncbi:GIY-YIG nuclease family protein [Phaeocystidibacter marisrubri]|uniref:GIY-YIG nuclease family protein n=1 Tax=Phaeocystidibacter marisrubri TaxID=1577780 RepID=A0A6L3ZDA5_9FLAO|nr:GIY-YIG nuclease family protein [Phaeocystidibacter marisrubri]KAB2815825.1 GIY-YIG nuclease family protein [Phaeocystidibacter marisrubri]GGH65905.1 methionine sulfoxide reductase [Phaeocystidibacter marisrubri]
MKSKRGISISQYLTSGDANGVVCGYLSNWTGQCVRFPRNLLKSAQERDELQRPGVYFLIGSDPDDLSQSLVYVGESENLAERLSNHARDAKKEFWEKTIVFSSKDEILTKGHVRYLETRLINELTNAKRLNLVNNGALKDPKLPEIGRDEMEAYLDNLRLLMPMMGFDFWEEDDRDLLPKKQRQLLFAKLTRPSVEAKGYLTPTGFKVLAGSQMGREPRPSFSKGYKALRDRLISKGFVGVDFQFVSDYEFSSPSAAISIIAGMSLNGRDYWKDERGRSLNEMES